MEGWHAYNEENTVGADAEEPLETADNNGSPRPGIISLASLALFQLLKINQGGHNPPAPPRKPHMIKKKMTDSC